jgi:hypothetical protein
MHVYWNACPKAHAGAYKGKEGRTTIILEAVASQDLWIWHADFGIPGRNIDITVLRRSSLFKEYYTSGKWPTVPYTLNGDPFNMMYLLVDGIYPPWSLLVPAIGQGTNPAYNCLTRMQEAARKDVERAFGVLQKKFRILVNPVNLWDVESITDMVLTCIILHNMDVEESLGLEKTVDERDFDEGDEPNLGPAPAIPGNTDAKQRNDRSLIAFTNRTRQLRSADKHAELKLALAQHVYLSSMNDI